MLKELNEYEKKQFKLGYFVQLFGIKSSLKDVQNWTDRGFLSPQRPGPKKDRLYSLSDGIKALVIDSDTSYRLGFRAKLAFQVSEMYAQLIMSGRTEDVSSIVLCVSCVDGASYCNFMTNEQLTNKVLEKGFFYPCLSITRVGKIIDFALNRFNSRDDALGRECHDKETN